MTIKDKLENDPRVAFTNQTHGAGFYIFLNEHYYYEPDLKKGKGVVNASFIHRPTQQEAFKAMDNVIRINSNDI